MRVPMLVVAMIATPLFASVSHAQARSTTGNRQSEVQQKGKHGEKKHADKAKCAKAPAANDEQNQQGQHEDANNDEGDGKSCAPAPTPITPPPAAVGLAEVHGMAFNDLNGNGVLDAGEPPLVGWPVSLTGTMSATTVTGSNGSYAFVKLPVGSYTACAGAGRAQTAPLSGPACPSGGAGYTIDVPAYLPDLWYTGIDFGLR